MRQVTIGPNQAGQRLDKFLHKYLPEAGAGFLYKMLRKKNITLNAGKAEGKEILAPGDVVTFFFAEETFLKFAGRGVAGEAAGPGGSADIAPYRRAYEAFGGDIEIIFENADIVVLNKPAGILTQKAQAHDLSLNEWLVGYLLDRGAINREELHSFKPSVCNRLDRNTSGLVLCGKSLAGSRYLSGIIRERSVSKFYRTICVGELRGDRMLEGYLVKDGRTNRVKVLSDGGAAPDADKTRETAESRQAGFIRTACHPLVCGGGYTLLEVELITGKSHQIRAHLAGIGHPIAGDYKYGDRRVNDALKDKCGLEYQLLHACRVVLPDGRELAAPYPEQFCRVAKLLGLPL